MERDGSDPVVQIRLFGGVAAVNDRGAPVDVGGAKSQTVLAALALSAGSAVSVSRLIDVVWGEQSPRTAEKTLQSYVTRLRRALGPNAIVRTGAAYRLDVEPDAVDVTRFRRLLDAGDVEAALAEWTAPPLAGVAAPGLAATVDGLVEQWLGATETHLERLVETDAQSAIGPLTELTADHPFREGLWVLLMTALYRVGRQADALAAFRTARQHLVDELGVEPSPRLHELEAAILGHDDRLRSSRRTPERPTGTVTFGFAEVDDPVRMMHRRDMPPAAARLDELVHAAVERHGGYVFTTGGMSYGVAFHRARDAAAWATELQAAAHSEAWPGGIELRPRIGLHTGETDEHAAGYFGPAVHVAARIAAAGHSGQTLASAVTAALLDRDDLRPLGTYHLDGVIAEQAILQIGDGDHPPLRTDERDRGNLPTRQGRLIGRDADLEVITGALAASAAVTLVGPGGIGKTRLALAAAQLAHDDRATGTWLVELAEIAAATDVPRAVADTLRITEHPGRTLTQSIVAALRARPALLILDNCEHVIDGAAALAQALAEQCPDTRMLATSREALGVTGERLVAVAPLDPTGAAVELFTERALAVDQTFDPHAHRSPVEEICRRLDGVPLAIELAAARIRTLTPTDLVARLDDHLRLLTGGRRTSVERHRTLRATIQWSYDLLTPPEQTLFQRLSIFAGPFDLAAAETVAPDAERAPVDDLVGDLVERSMLIVESGPFGRHFRMLETMRQFAAELLSSSGDTDFVAERHARWCRHEVTRIHRLLTGPAEVEGVARLDELWPNLRAAFDWACATRDRDLADALVRPLVTEINTRAQSEIGDWAERILALTPADDEERILFWLTWATSRHMQRVDHDAYERLLRHHGHADHPLLRYTRAYLTEDGEALARWSPEAVAALRRQGEDHAADLVEFAGVASGLLTAGRFAELDTFASALVERYRTHGPPTFLHWSLGMLAFSALFQGRHDLADRFFEESAAIHLPDRTISANQPIAARAAFTRGDRRRAFRILQAHVDDLLQADNMDIARLACIEFINMMTAIDRVADAARLLSYLETTGHFGELATSTVVADAVARITDTDAGQVPPLTARQALLHMRDVLDELTDGRQSPS